ncbi:MAG: hypothetical protein IH586_19680, partial [Anaerolineaceae bacterium]|nr:hypothetical protein [Anaerolineaceae bacterium]
MPAWIPRDTLNKIKKAVERKDEITSVFYITSQGGEGKTVLLRQMGMWLGSPDGIQPSKTILKEDRNVRYSGILDLYHSEVNTNSGLESHIMKGIEDKDEFRDFILRRQIFTTRRRSGLPPAELEEERQKMASTFADCFNKVSRWERVVTAIDTAERVQYEMDEIQIECGIKGETTNVCEWLITQLSLWKNCVVLLVGRPEKENPYLRKELEEKINGLAGVHYESLTLGGFNPGEAERFFDQAREDPELAEILNPDFCEKLGMAVNRSPIRLELAMEAIHRGYDLEKLTDKVREGTSAEIQEQIDKLLIEYVLNPEPHHKENQVLRYLAVARKGLNLDLLFYLVND